MTPSPAESESAREGDLEPPESTPGPSLQRRLGRLLGGLATIGVLVLGYLNGPLVLMAIGTPAMRLNTLHESWSTGRRLEAVFALALSDEEPDVVIEALDLITGRSLISDRSRSPRTIFPEPERVAERIVPLLDHRIDGIRVRAPGALSKLVDPRQVPGVEAALQRGLVVDYRRVGADLLDSKAAKLLAELDPVRYRAMAAHFKVKSYRHPAGLLALDELVRIMPAKLRPVMQDWLTSGRPAESFAAGRFFAAWLERDPSLGGRPLRPAEQSALTRLRSRLSRAGGAEEHALARRLDRALTAAGAATPGIESESSPRGGRGER